MSVENKVFTGLSDLSDFRGSGDAVSKHAVDQGVDVSPCIGRPTTPNEYMSDGCASIKVHWEGGSKSCLCFVDHAGGQLQLQGYWACTVSPECDSCC